MDDTEIPLSYAFFERMTEPERRPKLIMLTKRLDFYLKDHARQSADCLTFDLEMFESGRIYCILRDILTYCISTRRNYYIDCVNQMTNISPHKKRSAVASGLRVR